jgi:hypothetical protein
MKVWFKDIGDQKPILITPESWDRPGEQFFLADADIDSRKYLIQWNGDTPVLIDNPEYPAIILDEQTKAAESSIRAQGAAQLRALTMPYSEVEIQTWQTQEKEALEWQANNDAPCVTIRNMAATRGIDVSLLVQKILANAAKFKQYSGMILGAQQAALDQLYPEKKEEI